jgi:thiol-disulfide isomerase/thioredoxin
VQLAQRPIKLVDGCARAALLITLLVTLLVTLLAACTTSQAASVKAGRTGASGAADSPGTTTWPGSSGPVLAAISGTTLSGSHLSLGALHHDVLVINTWASWCYPCRTESPALANVARATAGKGIIFVGIDEQDTSSEANQFAASVHSSYPSLVDSDGSLLAALRIVPARAIPSTLVVLPDGHVAARIIGPTNAAQLIALLRPLESRV